MNFTEEQKNFILELIEKEMESYKKIRSQLNSSVRRESLHKFDTATSAAFKRFSEKLKKEL
jgi:hypothetical protein